MKLALIGDVHGNAAALATVLAAARTEGVTQILNTGDMVGYYYRPADVLAQFQAWSVHTVRGNHDDMLKRADNDPAYLDEVTAKYGSGLACALKQLSEADLSWIDFLPRSLQLDCDGMKLLLCHGTPRDTDQYVYPDAPYSLIEKIEMHAGPDVDMVVLGHTHHQMIIQRPTLRIVNPGSVGQPRDRQPGAAWALLDTRSGQVDLRREAYDTDSVVQEAQQRDPQLPYLWTVLNRQ